MTDIKNILAKVVVSEVNSKTVKKSSGTKIGTVQRVLQIIPKPPLSK